MQWQDDIAELYMEMTTENGCLIPDNLKELSDEVVVEKSSSHAEGKEVMKLLKIAMKEGLVDAVETKSGYMVKSLVDDSQFLIHKGGKDFHPLRRYLNGLKRNDVMA